MGSTRLPGKILKPLGNKTLLEHILFRLAYLQHPAKIVIATTTSKQDDAVASFCKKAPVACFRGSETNVLERYYSCAKQFGFDQVVRLTGDNPFTDVCELDRLIDLHLETQSDFSHSFAALPVGVGAEIFSFNALEKCYRESSKPHHFEHVDEYMLENPRFFKTSLLKVEGAKNQPKVRLTVDSEEDYRRACFIVEQANTACVSTDEAIRLCMPSV